MESVIFVSIVTGFCKWCRWVAQLCPLPSKTLYQTALTSASPILGAYSPSDDLTLCAQKALSWAYGSVKDLRSLFRNLLRVCPVFAVQNSDTSWILSGCTSSSSWIASLRHQLEFKLEAVSGSRQRQALCIHFHSAQMLQVHHIRLISANFFYFFFQFQKPATWFRSNAPAPVTGQTLHLSSSCLSSFCQEPCLTFPGLEKHHKRCFSNSVSPPFWAAPEGTSLQAYTTGLH